MPDDPKDELARLRAATDQGAESLKELAGPIWAFYCALSQEGFSGADALRITIAWLTATITAGAGGADA